MSASLPPIIAIEEHFDSTLFPLEDPLHSTLPERTLSRISINRVSTLRLPEMSSAGITTQVLAHTPINPTPTSLCAQSNALLAKTCSAHPSRFKAWAQLPMQEPSIAAAELEKCVREYGFVGAMINNSLSDGTMYDGPEFRPVFAKAVELDVPIYLHPCFPPDTLSGNFPRAAATLLSSASWSWHAQTGLHVLRLYASGLFDELPGLKIVLGHMGEMLPFMLERTAHSMAHWGEFQSDFETVWKENFWITTSGMFSLDVLEFVLKVCGKERVMFALDYPFSGVDTGREYLERVRAKKVFDEEGFAAFCGGTARTFLKIGRDSD